MDSKSIADKPAKLAYLEKIINCVGHSLGEAPTCKAAKIVAGLEADQTNVFLQQLAKVCWQRGSKSVEGNLLFS